MENELTEKEKKEVKMFGCTVKSMENAKPDFIGKIMYATSILSDAQEVLVRGDGELARQFINKAKYFIMQTMTLNWVCPNCGEIVKYSKEYLPEKITCPKCGLQGKVDQL